MIKPALCKLAVKPHDKPGYVWERKYDGARLLPIIEPDGYLRMQARSGTDKTAQFPEIVQGVDAPRDSILDGEVISATGLSFQDFLQRRVNRTEDIMENAEKNPCIFMAFDAIRLAGVDLSGATLLTRRTMLRDVVGGPAVRFPTEGRSGTEMFARAETEGWEGVVGKDLSEPYLFGKRCWLKVKVWRYGVFRVVGFSPGEGRREGVAGSFQLVDDDDKPVGSVGTGFDDDELARLTTLVRSNPGTVRFHIKYAEVTNSGQLRFPVYLCRAEVSHD